MSYAADHAGALADIKEAGADVTFSKNARTYDRGTGRSTVSAQSVVGYAIEVRGSPRVYEALGLKITEAVTLVFAANTYGDIPNLGMTCSWGGETYTVRDVSPTAPDGIAILARVVVAV